MPRILSWILVAATCVAVAPPAAVLSQDKKNDAAKILGQTLETGSLPFWSNATADARQNLGKAARTTEQGVFLVGYGRRSDWHNQLCQSVCQSTAMSLCSPAPQSLSSTPSVRYRRPG